MIQAGRETFHRREAVFENFQSDTGRKVGKSAKLKLIVFLTGTWLHIRVFHAC
jgi:hypothetical protein